MCRYVHISNALAEGVAEGLVDALAESHSATWDTTSGPPSLEDTSYLRQEFFASTNASVDASTSSGVRHGHDLCDRLAEVLASRRGVPAVSEHRGQGEWHIFS